MADITAFLFPGQGRVPDALPPHADMVEPLLRTAEAHGLPLRRWILEGAAERLERTDAMQPALFIDSIARNATLRAAGWAPDIVAGHSLGEYAALVSAGVLTAEAALAVVIERGRLMSDVEGAMAAILKLDLATVERLCDDVGDGVCIANHNSPAQIVVSGEADAVVKLAKQAAEAGGRAIPLKVSGPFHSPQMAPAERALEPALRRLRSAPAAIPVVSARSGEILREPDRLIEAMTHQITSPVLWVRVIETLESFGVTRAVEVGSGDVLCGLGRRTTDTIRFMTHEEALDERV